MSIDRRQLALGSLGAIALGAKAAPAGAQSPDAFARDFLRAFENLDMDAFIACFAADATVFFPLPEPPERFDGRAAIREHFQGVFDAIRGDAKSGPPYHRLNPEDFAVQKLGPDAAVVTFHLKSAQRTARRSLVLHFDRRWNIVHLHASNVVT